MFHCPVGVWVIEQHAIILSATVRSPTVVLYIYQLVGLWSRGLWLILCNTNGFPEAIDGRVDRDLGDCWKWTMDDITYL